MPGVSAGVGAGTLAWLGSSKERNVKPFRIERQGQQPVRMGMAGETESAYSEYMDRLVKLIPAEVIGVYLVVSGLGGLGPGSGADGDWLTAWWPVCCVLLVIGSRIWGTSVEGRGVQDVQWKGVAVSAVSFVIWVYAMGHTMLDVSLPDDRLAAVAVVVWTFVIPWFYRGGEG